MVRWRTQIVTFCMALAFLQGFVVWADSKTPKAPKKRAAPPAKWDSGEVKSAFFDNVFDGKVLSGDRPTNLGTAVSVAKTSAGSTGTNVATPAAGDAGAGSGWAKIISPTAIEDEVKATKKLVDAEVSTPTDFAGKGYKLARRNFSVLAMLFGIAGEFDGDVRWKADAPSARDLFAKSAANAKVGTEQAYKEAKQRKADLQDLIGGAGLSTKGSAEAKAAWSQVCDRSPLMMRLELSMEPRLQQWTADKANFKANQEQILHEAQVVAAIAEVICKEGMEDADTAEYKAFAQKMKQAALDVVDGVKLNSDEQARKAVGVINKSCTECHENYRS